MALGPSAPFAALTLRPTSPRCRPSTSQPITTTAAIAGVKRDAAELTMARLSLGRATRNDLPFIMETERLPGFDKMVGRWTADQHKAAYSKPSYAYLIGTEIGGEAFGFAIIRDLDDPHGNV